MGGGVSPTSWRQSKLARGEALLSTSSQTANVWHSVTRNALVLNTHRLILGTMLFEYKVVPFAEFGTALEAEWSAPGRAR